MGEELKSAYELAIARLAKGNGNAGESAKLSESQKEGIAAVRREYRALKAELEFSQHREIEGLAGEGDAEKLEKARARYRRRLEEVEEEATAKIAKIRKGP